MFQTIATEKNVNSRTYTRYHRESLQNACKAGKARQLIRGVDATLVLLDHLPWHKPRPAQEDLRSEGVRIATAAAYA